MSSRVADAGTSMVKRTLPLTWTGSVTLAAAARLGSASGERLAGQGVR